MKPQHAQLRPSFLPAAQEMRAAVASVLCAVCVAIAACSSERNPIEAPGVALPDAPPQKAPPDSAVELNRRACEASVDDREQALALIGQAIKEAPDYAQAHANRATILMAAKRFAEAAECLREAVSWRPDVAEYHVGLAMALRQAGRPDEAAERLRYAIAAYNLRVQRDAKDPNARANRALVVFLLGHKDLALRELDAVLEGAPGDPLSKRLKDQIASVGERDPWGLLIDDTPPGLPESSSSEAR